MRTVGARTFLFYLCVLRRSLDLRKDLGIHGFFNFKLCGHAAYLQKHLSPEGRGLGDTEPWSWPTMSRATLESKATAQPAQQAARASKTKAQKTPKVLNFASLTRTFVEHSVGTCKEAWVLAKACRLVYVVCMLCLLWGTLFRLSFRFLKNV